MTVQQLDFEPVSTTAAEEFAFFERLESQALEVAAESPKEFVPVQSPVGGFTIDVRELTTK